MYGAGKKHFVAEQSVCSRKCRLVLHVAVRGKESDGRGDDEEEMQVVDEP